MTSDGEVFQVAGGRWNWYDVALGDSDHHGRIDIGLLSFDTADQAQEDLRQHRQAGVTAAGRVVLPREHLETLALLAFEQYQRCVSVKAVAKRSSRRPAVRASAVDESGRGWEFALRACPACDECLAQLHSVVVAMRQRYSLDDMSWMLIAAQPVLPVLPLDQLDPVRPGKPLDLLTPTHAATAGLR